MKMIRFGGCFLLPSARRLSDFIAKGSAAPIFKKSFLLMVLIPTLL